jgi:hypothetical protein
MGLRPTKVDENNRPFGEDIANGGGIFDPAEPRVASAFWKDRVIMMEIKAEMNLGSAGLAARATSGRASSQRLRMKSGLT